MTRQEMLYWLEHDSSAISLSAQKWRDIRDELRERVELEVPIYAPIIGVAEHNGETCALCETGYGVMSVQDPCRVCPIGEATRIYHCNHTPYVKYHYAFLSRDMSEMQEAAEMEIELLEYLEVLLHPHMRNRNIEHIESDRQLHSR